MLSVLSSTRIFVCLQSVDFRKGIDGLAAVCRNKLSQNPLEGALFVFRNRTRTTLRLLLYDGQGFWLCTKRLSKGTFQWWPTEESTLNARQLHTLLWNGNPELAHFSKDWRQISVE